MNVWNIRNAMFVSKSKTFISLKIRKQCWKTDEVMEATCYQQVDMYIKLVCLFTKE